ncbi:hypothetical protein [Burkholderia sp. LMG 13014]|uniref:hypothetical protein n=1 Tax=Burkholderia sp. LMG 13014 TaxID=2709306 RepID=UPI0019631F3F|nr:hypothetical protein [Burkholderia sp. LMG 13014]
MTHVFTPQDIALATAIEAAAEDLDFNNAVDSYERLESLSIFTAALHNQLERDFPISFLALEQLVWGKAANGNPVTLWKQW